MRDYVVRELVDRRWDFRERDQKFVVRRCRRLDGRGYVRVIYWAGERGRYRARFYKWSAFERFVIWGVGILVLSFLVRWFA